MYIFYDCASILIVNDFSETLISKPVCEFGTQNPTHKSNHGYVTKIILTHTRISLTELWRSWIFRVIRETMLGM